MQIIFFLIFYIISFQVFSSNLKDSFLYDIQFGNVIVGKVLVNIEKDNEKTIVKTSIKTEGATNYIYKFKSDIILNITKLDEMKSSKSFSVISTLNKEKRNAKLVWKEENLEVKIDPPLNLKKVHDISKSSLKNVIDPVSSILKMIDHIKHKNSCEKQFRIYDGRRRYDLLSKKLEKSFINNDRPNSFNGDVMICGLKFIPIGGHYINSKWKPDQDKYGDIKVFFGNLSEVLFLPVRMELKRWFGTVIIRLIINKTY